MIKLKFESTGEVRILLESEDKSNLNEIICLLMNFKNLTKTTYIHRDSIRQKYKIKLQMLHFIRHLNNALQFIALLSFLGKVENLTIWDWEFQRLKEQL